MSLLKENHYVISDLHLGHGRIIEYSRQQFLSIDEHDAVIIHNLSALSKNSVCWLLGDVAFSETALQQLSAVPCHLRLVMGNHDRFSMNTYLEVFDRVVGLQDGSINGHRVLLSHIPVHPGQFERWKCNIHGHLHTDWLDDDRYINVTCEKLLFKPVRVGDLIKK